MFEIANYVEAGLWGLIGALFIAYGVRRGGPDRRRCMLAAVAFLLFGASDVVEVQTGAWWRPWWLPAWKGLCIASMVALLRGHLRNIRRG